MAKDAKKGGNPAQKSSDDKRVLLLEAVEALRGAENLRDRLLNSLQFGTPAVADLAYAIKARVKDDLKIVDKVLDRRQGSEGRPAKPHYSVSDVCDLVGLRIVTLYRLDMLEVIEALFSKLNSEEDSTSTFIKGSVSEIKVYSTNPGGDVQNLPKRVMDLCKDYGFSSITTLEERPSNYSSIHIVLKGLGKYKSEYREIPVEIQIRTALEDVWGQIEHSLRYKRENDISDAVKQTNSSSIATTLRHLGAMKTLIDGVSQYADQIKLQIEDLKPVVNSGPFRIAEDISARLASLKDVPDRFRRTISVALKRSEDANGRELAMESRIRLLRESLLDFDEISLEQVEQTGASKKSLKELKYIVLMNRALLNFQIGTLLDAGDLYLEKARRLYEEAEEAFPARIVVSYRLGLALDACGLREDAIAKLREVVDSLETDSAILPNSHWIRAAAPRILGVLLWEEARRNQQSSQSWTERNLALLQQSVELSRTSFAKADQSDPHSSVDERTKAANNLLFFSIEFAVASETPLELSEDETKEILELVGADDPSTISTVAAADTARRYYQLMSNDKLEEQAANRVLALAKPGKIAISQAVRDAMRSAELSLERLSAS